MCLNHQQPTSLIVTQVLSMTRHDNSLPKWPFSKTSITPRLPKSPRVSPLPKNRNTERPLVVPNSCLRPKLSTHSLLAITRSILQDWNREFGEGHARLRHVIPCANFCCKSDSLRGSIHPPISYKHKYRSFSKT